MQPPALRPQPFHLVFDALRDAWNATLGAPLLRVVENRIRSGLRGYEVRPNHVDMRLPERLPEGERRKVAVIGGGLAGISSAAHLAERGFEVMLYEAKDHLGGKLGAWTETMPDGTELPMEHGFHAFFGCYYNLDRFLTRLGIDPEMASVDDYVVVTTDGETLSFRDVSRIPFLNLVDTVWKGLFDWKALVFNPRIRQLDPLLHYVKDDTYAQLDETSFDSFARSAGLPSRMRLMFTTFTRAFFARADQMSMAALIQSFHLYYLSHDRGLGYRYPRGHHGTTLLDPMRAHLEAHGVKIRLGSPVGALSRQKNGRLKVDKTPFDHVVLATDCHATRRILEASPLSEEAPGLVDDLAALHNDNLYAVLRIWCDKDIRGNLPVFTFTEKLRVLDSVTACHRTEREHAAWVSEHGGAVLELHSYEVPERYTSTEEIREAFLADLADLFPETAGMTIQHEAWHEGRDFSAFHTGMHRHRPGTDVGIAGLALAGDWVDLPVPAMLMEGAFTAGMYAANHILQNEGLRDAQIYSVPLRGLLDGQN